MPNKDVDDIFNMEIEEPTITDQSGSDEPQSTEPSSQGQPTEPTETSNDDGIHTTEDGRQYIVESGKRVYLPSDEGDTPTDPAKPEKSSGAGVSTDPVAPTDSSTSSRPLTVEDVTSILTAVQQGQQPQGQQGQSSAPQLTPEQIDEQLQVWKPSPEFLEKLNNPETQVNAITEMRDGLIRQSATAAQYIAKMVLEPYLPVIQQAQGLMQRQQQESFKNEFYTQYPGLKGYEDILSMVAAAHASSGKKFKSKEEGFKSIAEGAIAVLKRSNPDFKLPEGASTTSPATTPSGSGAAPSTKTAMPKMSTTTTGGSSAGAAKPKAPARSDADLWD